MQFLPIILAIFSLMGKGVNKINENKEGKAIAFGFIAYFVYKHFKKKELGTTELGGLCIRMHEALHPFLDLKIPFIGYLPDSTNDSEVEAIANEIGLLNKKQEFFDAYELFYGDNLNEELVREGVLTKFNTAYNKGASGTIFKSSVTTKSTAQTPARVNSIGLNIIQGQRYKTKAGVNLRNTARPYTVRSVTKAGEVYKVLSMRQNMKIGDKYYVVADVSYVISKSTGVFGDSDLLSPFVYMVIIDAFTSKA